MSYEKGKILGVSSRPNKQSGEIEHYADVEIIRSDRIKLQNAESINSFRALAGKVALIPAEYATIEGRTFLIMRGDGIPYPVPMSPASDKSSVQFPSNK